MTAVNQMDFTEASGSCEPVDVCYRVTSLLAMPEIWSKIAPGKRQQKDFGGSVIFTFPEFWSRKFGPDKRQALDYSVIPGDGGSGTTCSAVYTYYQRVFDDTFSVWCYYSGSTINAAPGTTTTTPNNSGDISGHSITYVTDEIVCS